MKHLAKIIGISLCIMHISSFAQKSLTYQVLIANKASSHGHEISQFDQLLPGDTIEIRSLGYIALISSYFHPLEHQGDTTFVLPNYGREDIGNAFERPDLQVLYSDQSFHNQLANNGVDHAQYFMDLLYPLTASHVISPYSGRAVPLIWQDHRDNDQQNDEAQISISDMFYEVITEFSLEPDMSCLDLNHYPEVLKKLEQDSFIIIDLSQDDLNGRQFAVKLSSNSNWKHPFELQSCKIRSPIYALAMALFLEYNHTSYLETARKYYSLATQLSENPVYLYLLEAFIKRH
ncbi:hypothetical protein [Fulvivirga lutimaris]|uniref:hypothetical protein n=1 Tax=Fulvivirga lutimaris TaxID=1819566 RepID=UPI0012BBE3B0|nr:hypothetical protein [Fulvivirga lutimaris]MTI39544.1 hypothetical protein [Fulvivirga lutimaris]